MESPSRSPVAPLAWAAGSLVLLWALITDLTPGDPVALGRTVRAVTPEAGRFLGLYSIFGGFAAIALTIAAARLLDRRSDRPTPTTPDRQWILLGMLVAVLLPSLVRTVVLRDMPLTDDEGAYRFMAEVFAAGRAWVETPEPALFFDQRFLIHDGRSYAQYFPGWPAVLVPFVWLGATGWANALLAALAVPPLFWTLRRLAGPAWARLGLALYALSPMTVIGAATLLSHTSCVTALAWLTWWALRAADDDAPTAVFAGVAAAFSIAFAIRPLAALGVGTPFVLYALWTSRRRASPTKALAALALPAALGAAAFLGVIAAQTGSPFETPYERYLDYSRDNGFRFSLFHWEPSDGARELDFVGPRRSLAIAAAGVHRLGFDLLGWPLPVLLVAALAWARRDRPGRRLLWASVVTSLVSHVGVGNVGIDAFAPMHYFELGWPILLLAVLGLADLDRWARERLDQPHLGLAAAIGLSLVALAVFWPTRLQAVANMAADAGLPRQAVAELDGAVVFTPDPLVRSCHPPTRGWAFGRPPHDPFFRDPVIWVNHLSIEADRLLVERVFPDRRGFLLAIDPQCKPVLIPLDDPAAESIPDARVAGIDEVVAALRGRPTDSTGR